MKTYRILGTSPVRPDGADKVTGRAQYGADVRLPGMLYARILRSPHPHARIRSIDTSKAAALPGVAAVVTGADFPRLESEKVMDLGEGAIEVRYMTALALTRDVVHYRGQPVAAVAAVNPRLAEEALALIEVEYEELPVVDDVLEAMKPGAPILHDHLRTQTVGDAPTGPTNVAAHVQHLRGASERAFAEADVVIEREFRTQMVHQGYIEPCTATAQVAHDGKITIWTSTQGAWNVRADVAEIFQVPVGRVKVVPMEIGGGFGGKFAVYLEPVVVLLSMKTGRPVKAVMSRSEVFEATGPASASYIRIKLGASREGRLLAAEAFLAYDAGAFPGSPVASACQTGLSPYRIPHLKIDGYDVVTNHPRVEAYRAPGATPIAFAVETVLDEIAEALAMDPVDLRLRNAARPGDRMTNDVVFPSIGFVEVLEAVKRHPHYNSPEPAGPFRGRGFAAGFWMNGRGTSTVHLTFAPDGTVNLLEGSTDIGGTRASMAMIVAEELGLEYHEVRPSVGDTESVGYNDGTGGSRTTYSTGVACYRASHDAIQQLRPRAARLLQADEADVEFADGVFRAKGRNGEIHVREVIRRLGDTGGPIVARGVSGGLQMAPGFGALLVDLEVDPDTGKLTFERITVFQDAGKAIHRAFVEGQMQGGAAQGIGWGVSEEYVFENGRMLNPSFLDYRIPTALDLPMIDTVIVEVPATDGPYGVRGVGEVPIVPPPAAIANAIYRAVGVRLRELPMKPERVWAAMRARDSRQGAARRAG